MSSDPPVFEAGDMVRVRSEPWTSEVVVPTHRRPDCMPKDTPDIGVCCVPIALVRPPPERGVLRWVEVADLTPIGDQPPASSSDPPA